MEIITSDYVDIEFTKAVARRIAHTDESHYASVVIATPLLLLDREKLYRVTCDHKATAANGTAISVKFGDVVLSEQESDGLVFGTLLQKKGGTPIKLNLEIKNLQLYERAASCQQSTVDEDPEEDVYVNQDGINDHLARKNSLPKPIHPPIAAKPVSLSPTGGSVSPKILIDPFECDNKMAKNIPIDLKDIENSKPQPLDKWKPISIDKIQNTKANSENGILVFALVDMKKSKEPNRLVYKKYQCGKLLYSKNDWWYICLGETKGWASAYLWRILPENKKDDISSHNYVPWTTPSIDKLDLDKHFSTIKEKEFAIQTVKTEKQTLDVKEFQVFVRDAQTTKKFQITVKENSQVITTAGQSFHSIHNFVLYYKKHNLPIPLCVKLGKTVIVE